MLWGVLMYEEGGLISTKVYILTVQVEYFVYSLSALDALRKRLVNMQRRMV